MGRTILLFWRMLLCLRNYFILSRIYLHQPSMLWADNRERWPTTSWPQFLFCFFNKDTSNVKIFCRVWRLFTAPKKHPDETLIFEQSAKRVAKFYRFCVPETLEVIWSNSDPEFEPQTLTQEAVDEQIKNYIKLLFRRNIVCVNLQKHWKRGWSINVTSNSHCRLTYRLCQN